MNRNETMNVRMIRAESGGRKYSLCRRLRYSGSTGLRIVYGPNIAGTVMTCAFPGNAWRFQVQGSDKSNKQTRLSLVEIQESLSQSRFKSSELTTIQTRNRLVAGSAQLRSSIRTQVTSYTNSARHRQASQLGRESTLCASRLATGDERKREIEPPYI